MPEPIWFPALFCGCYRAEVFRRVGLFNERLTRSQDLEFNLRLQRAGGRGLLVPSIVSTYYARSGLGDFVRHTYGNGVWAILPFAYSDIIPVSWRQVIPLGFVLTLGALAAFAVAANSTIAAMLLASVFGAYLVANLVASFSSARRRNDWSILLALPVVFTTFHVTYGLGSLWGALRVVREWIVNGFRRPSPIVPTLPASR